MRYKMIDLPDSIKDLFFKATPDLLFLIDSSQKIKYVNPACITALGWVEKEILGKKYTEFIHPADLARIKKQASVDRADIELPSNFTIRWQCKESTYIWLEWSTIAISKKQVLAVAHDITASKQKVTALQESEQEKEVILGSISELVAYVDLELRIKWANKAAADSVNQSVDELVGQYCYKVWSQQDEPCIDCPVKKAIATNKPQRKEMSTPDGRFWFINAYPVQGENGDVIGAVEITRDITIEKQLIWNLRDVLSNSPDGIIIADSTGHHRYVNERLTEMLGYSVDECLDLTIEDLMPPDQLAKYRQINLDRIAGKKVLNNYESIILTKSGQELPVRLRTTTTVWEGEKCSLVYLTELVQQKRAEKIQKALYNISKLSFNEDSFEKQLTLIQSYLSDIIDITDFYIGILDKESNTIHEPYSKDRYDKFTSYPVEKSLTGYVIKTGKPLLADEKLVDKMVEDGVVENIGTPTKQWLGAPLTTSAGVFGAIVLESYDDPKKYTNKDLQLLKHIANEIGSLVNTLHAQEYLAESEKRYKTLFNFAPVGIGVHWEGKWLTLNRAALDMLGYDTAEELIDQPVMNIMHPDSRDEAAARIQQLLSTGKESPPLEEKLITKSGNTIYALTSATLINYQGRTAIQAIAVDITSQKQSERILEENEKKLRDIIENSTNLFYSHTADNELTYLSPQCREFLQCEPAEAMIEWTEFATDHPVNIKGIEATKKAIKTGQRQPPYELQLKGKKGRVIWTEVRETPVTENGKTVAVVGSLTDITERKQSEKLLKESEEKYRLIVENANDGIEITQNDKIIFCNQRFADMLGYTRDEMRDIIFSNIFTSEAKEDLLKRQAARERGDDVPTKYEATFRKKNGSIIEVDVHYEIIEYKGIPATFAIVRDITSINQAKEELKRSEAKFREMAELLPEVVYECDIQGEITFANKVAFEKFGYTQEDFDKGVNALQFIVDNDNKRANENMGKILSGIGKGPYEYTAQRKDRSSFPAIIYSAPIVQDAKPIGLRGIIVDITDRKKAEEALLKERDFAENLIETAQIIVLVLDTGGRIVRFNHYMEELTGYKLSEVQGKNWFDTFLPKEDHTRIRNLFREALGNNQTKNNINPIVSKEGSKIDIEWYDKTLKDTDGNVVGILSTGQDITSRRQAEIEREKALVETRQANNVKDLFLANISHEIRTPLNSILGFSEILQGKFESQLEEDEREYFDIINNSSQRLLKTVHEILDVSQFAAGTYPHNPTIIVLSSAIAQIYKQFQLEASTKHLEFTFDNQLTTAGHIKADEHSLTKALSNLIDNAIKYTQKGYVHLALFEKGKQYILTITDSGVGIDRDYMSRMYDAFSQESEGYTKHYQGLGLGLSIVKQCLDANSVEISVESQKNEGTKFTLSFELVINAEQAVETVAVVDHAVDKKAPTKTKNKPVILLVEDDPNNIKTLVAILKNEYETPHAIDITGARESLCQHDVDLILLDLSLSGGENGLDLLPYLKAKDQYKAIPVIAVTAHAFPKDRDNVLAAGCDEFITKPIDIKLLLKTINKYCSS